MKMRSAEIQKKRLEREAFCKKMWAETKKKKKEFREGVEKYRERLRTKPLTKEGKSNKQSQTQHAKLPSGGT